MDGSAGVYTAQQKYARAEALYIQTLETERRVLGPEHPNTLYTLSDLASMYQRYGKLELRKPLLRLLNTYRQV